MKMIPIIQLSTNGYFGSSKCAAINKGTVIKTEKAIAVMTKAITIKLSLLKLLLLSGSNFCHMINFFCQPRIHCWMSWLYNPLTTSINNFLRKVLIFSKKMSMGLINIKQVTKSSGG